jgi:hypothetical protein
MGAERGTRLPTFLVIGTQKAGTTSVWEFLRRHPQVFMPDVKELNFFIEEGSWHKGIDWYRSLFAGARPDQQIGEASPGYTMFPIFSGAPARIAAVIPDVKLLYMVRHPIERMRSSYLQSVATGLETRPMREALLLSSQYVTLSLYALQIEQFLEHFDRSQLLVEKSEDLAADAAATLGRVQDFLGIDAGAAPDLEVERHNTSAGKLAPRRRAIVAARALRRAGRPALATRVATSPSKLLARPLDEAAIRLDDDLYQRLLGWIRPDLQRLRILLGEGFDAWGLL